MSGHALRIKRIYDEPSPDDGFRVLVDRLWPRGVSKARAELGLWLQEVAPSAALRRWWGHDPARLEEFTARYRNELAGNPALEALRGVIADHPTTTLLYGAPDPVLNQARVLRDYLDEDTA